MSTPSHRPRKAVDVALKLATKAERRPPTGDDAPPPSVFPGKKPRLIEGQLALEPAEGGTQ